MLNRSPFSLLLFAALCLAGLGLFSALSLQPGSAARLRSAARPVAGVPAVFPGAGSTTRTDRLTLLSSPYLAFGLPPFAGRDGRLPLTGDCGLSNALLPNVMDTLHFHIEYDTLGGGLDIADYTYALETAWTAHIDTFGWAAPPVYAPNPPPGNRYHVRIDVLAADLPGYVTASGVHAGPVGDNPATTWDDLDAYATCMVLNRDFSLLPGIPSAVLQAAAARSLNQAILIGYGALTNDYLPDLPDLVFVHGMSSMMEDEIFDAVNDNYGDLWPDFTLCMGEYSAEPEAYWIAWRGMSERFGAGAVGGSEQVLQDFWELTSQNAVDNLDALNSVLSGRGVSLADAFHAYAAAVKFNRACDGGYVYPYCLEEGPDYVAARGPTPLTASIPQLGDIYTGTLLNNYALNWIGLPTQALPYALQVDNLSTQGILQGSLVCDTGTALQITALPGLVGPGESRSIQHFDPAGCLEVVLVLTNQNQTAANPAQCNYHAYRAALTLSSQITLTPTPTGTLTVTHTPTPTSTVSPTGAAATATPTPSATLHVSQTAAPSATLTTSATPGGSLTPFPPTATSSPTAASSPTVTGTPPVGPQDGNRYLPVIMKQ